MAKKKTDRTREAAPKAKSGKPAAKKAEPGKAAKAPKSRKSTKKPKAAKPRAAAAKAGHDFPKAIRDIVRDAGTPLTLDQIHAEHEARFQGRSLASVKKAVVSLVESNQLVVSSPAAGGGFLSDDPQVAIPDLLCNRLRRPLSEEEIFTTLTSPPFSKPVSREGVHLALVRLSSLGTIRRGPDGRYSCIGGDGTGASIADLSLPESDETGGGGEVGVSGSPPGSGDESMGAVDTLNDLQVVILDLLCNRQSGPLSEDDIFRTLTGPRYRKDASIEGVHFALLRMSPPRGNKIQRGPDGRYSCGPS